MKPIPAPSSRDGSPADIPPSTSDLIKSTPAGFANTNRRSPQASVNRAYPWLLLLSTAVAVVFGFMYITKPVVVAGMDVEDSSKGQALDAQGQDSGKPTLLPGTDALPGEHGAAAVTQGDPRKLTTAPIHSRFEETNMRVQHILTATSDDGHVSRIDLEVPVLYQSRNLRWTPAEVTRAQDLMVRLMDYQDKSRQLRSQGEELLADWNDLIGKSIPASRLRADSPSIPENQHHAIKALSPSDTSTPSAVEIDSKEDQP